MTHLLNMLGRSTRIRLKHDYIQLKLTKTVLGSCHAHVSYQILSSLFIATFYPCEGDSDMQDIFNQSNISNYDRQYVEELRLQIF